MIKLLLKKFVDNLNKVSLSTTERDALRKDFLARTGLRAAVRRPSLKSSFVLASSDDSNFELQLVEDGSSEAKRFNRRNLQNLDYKKETRVQNVSNGAMIKVRLNVINEADPGGQPCTPETCVILKVVRSM